MEKNQSREAGKKREERIVRCFPLAVQDVNCYFWGDGETGRGFLIDPGEQGKELLDYIREQGWTLAGILLTHGHFDHIGGIAGILAEAEVPFRIHEAGKAYLADPGLNLSAWFPPEIRLKGAQTLRDGDRISPLENPGREQQTFREGGGISLLGDPEKETKTACALEVIHTPGHTPDSVTFYDREAGLAFTGDTIFAHGGRGNDRFPGGNGAQLVRSIRERILTLPAETVLYSGHSEKTTVGAEKRWY